MDPNDGKEYQHQYVPQMPYGGDFGGYMPNEYGQMPGQPLSGMPLGPSPQIRNPYLAQPQPQMSYPPAAPGNMPQSTKIKGKRRSKNETEGRNYKCNQCERTYLSYPALYTHIKTKHSTQGEAPMTSGRGRGRPKKNLAKEERIDPTSPLYFRTEDRKGGPTAVIYQFKEAYDILFGTSKKYGGYEKHPLYIELYKLHLKNVNTLNYTAEHPGCTEFGLPPPNLPAAVYNLKPAEPAPSSDGQPAPQENSSVGAAAPESKDNSAPAVSQPPAGEDKAKLAATTKQEEDSFQKKKQKKCDEIFAEYLDSVARVVNKECYRQVLKFVFLFRECLNHYGERLNKSKQEPAGYNLGSNGKAEEGKQEEYCMNNNAEQAPEVSNEFVTLYLDEVKASFGKMDAIELTQNFCGWLFNSGYTCSKLSLIQENPQ
eukprot:TRINITY_DN182_c0_g2_i1.p1 TRINITY_DN182_c0_g2~~TRINITY_DN182_c0_g2_i1.p1  ORF type:complete len:427 (+),score=53.64 TRINITY_DN182_c0_g2_i1:1754-3034(+)